MKCDNILKSLAFCQGRPVRPGIKRKAYVAPKTAIAKFPTLPVDDLGRPTSALLVGSFVMNEDTYFVSIEHLANKADFKSETQGEYPSQTLKNTVTLIFPGIDKDAALASGFLLNSDNVVIVEDMYGQFRVIGSELYETITTYARDQGQGPTGTAGTTMVFEASDIIDCPFYAGEIVTEDGIINEQDEGKNPE